MSDNCEACVSLPIENGTGCLLIGHILEFVPQRDNHARIRLLVEHGSDRNFRHAIILFKVHNRLIIHDD